MADTATQETKAASTAPDKRKRTVKKGRLLTFIYKDADGNVLYAKTKTNAFSVKQAWEDCKEAKTIDKETEFVFAFSGMLDPVSNKLRMPTRDELMKIAGLEIE